MTTRSVTRHAGHTGCLLAVSLVLAGCAGPSRESQTEAELQERAASEAASLNEAVHDAVGKIMERLVRETEEEGIATLDILALSGGGDLGAFGAGFLVGWGDAEDESARRPEFDVVTGVSTGALLAPFAYLGTQDDCLAVETFYRNPKKDWIKQRFLFFMPSNPSFATLPGLERDLRGVVDETFVARLAEESETGKLLIISASDLDLGRQMSWGVGEEAELATAAEDPSKVQDIMLASSAIPIAFPPREIDGTLYADGGVTANVFFKFETRDPRALLPRWKAEHPDLPFPRVRYWVIINNRLAHIPKTVQPKWTAMVSPTLDVAIRSAMMAEVRWLAAQVDYVNTRYDTDIEVRVVAIPSDWRPPVEGAFKKEAMDALCDLGREMGADPASWQLFASPETALGGMSSAPGAAGTDRD